MSVKEQILSIVLSSPTPLTNREIADDYGFNFMYVRKVLSEYRKDGLVHARKYTSGDIKGFMWEYARPNMFQDEARVFREAIPEYALPGDRDVDAAIERNRPHWRKGELFTKEEKEEFKRRHLERRRYALLGR